MQNEGEGNQPPANPENQTPPEFPPEPGRQQNEMRQNPQDAPHDQQPETIQLQRDIRSGEIWLIMLNAILIVINSIVAVIYYGQLVQMREATKAAKDSAVAAQSAANTASATLTNQQHAFEIDQRPYVIVISPEFYGLPNPPPLMPGRVFANIKFRNIGRTPAIKVRSAYKLARHIPINVQETPGGADRLVAFWERNFTQLGHELDEIDTHRFHEIIRNDLAPTADTFSSPFLDGLTPTEIQEIATENLIIYLFAVVRYTDSFGNRYESEGCWMFLGNDTRVWHTCQAHNIIQ
jgi:hypothetical protein